MLANKQVSNSKPMTDIIEAGVYPAVLYSIIDLWTQTTTSAQFWTSEKRKILLQWEIPEIMHVFTDEKWPQPVSVRWEFTASTHKNAQLRGVIDGFLGKKLTDEEAKTFDIWTLLGKTCMITVVHNGEYVNVSSVSNRKTTDKELEAINPLRLLDLDNFDEKVFKTLHERTQDKIKLSPEYQKIENTEDLPF